MTDAEFSFHPPIAEEMKQLMKTNEARGLLTRIQASGRTGQGLAPELGSPDDLVAFHRAVMELAQARADIELVDGTIRAAGLVAQLQVAWAGREYAGDEVRGVANEAFAAVVQGLRPVARVVSDRWYDLADGWITHVRMMAERKL